MRTRLFFAFLAVISTALISNLLFRNFIEDDFDEYLLSSREDKLYWVLAAAEESYSQKGWNAASLHESVHWGMMLGFDVKVSDPDGNDIITSSSVLDHLSDKMRQDMFGMVDLHSAKGPYEGYPLYFRGKEIATLFVRDFQRMGSLSIKEKTFKGRGRQFLVTSFLIAGGGAILLAVFLSLFLSRPLNKMKKAVEALARGDFSVRIPVGNKSDEIGRLSNSFNFMAEALQREEALRRHLTSNIAHELRTPLTVMKANVEAVIDGVIIDHGSALENIRLEVEKLIRLVEGIEDITKAEASFFAGKNYSKINLRDFIFALVSKVSPLAAEKGLKISVIFGGSFELMTDPEKLEIILQNIISNAIKHTDSGEITVSYGLDKQLFFVEIKDTGKGIAEEEKELVFQRFYRGEDSKGLGLGLAIVRELVDVMGGKIELQSEPGRGTTFRIWLPAGK